MAFGASAGGVDNTALTRAKSITALAVNQAKENRGVIGALLGRVDDRAVDGYVQAENLKWNVGQKFSVHVIASTETVGTSANQAAAIAARSRDALNNFALSQEFSMTRFVDTWDLDNFDLEYIRGGEPTAPAGDYETNVKNAIAEWAYKTLQTHICTNQTQARDTFGGLPFIVDNANTYIGDRTDGAHTYLQSYVTAAGAAISLTGNVLSAQTNVQARGGWPSLIVLPTALHTKLHGQVISAGFYSQTDGEDAVGAPRFMCNGSRVILEPGLDASFSGTMFLLNEKDWKFIFSNNAMGLKMMEDPGGVDSTAIRMAFCAGVACDRAYRQGKVTGLS